MPESNSQQEPAIFYFQLTLPMLSNIKLMNLRFLICVKKKKRLILLQV
ncbi:MAG: hypothetical protein ACI9DJ_003434 [Algoriphagus sp.]|jgi:hypothetical protein